MGWPYFISSSSLAATLVLLLMSLGEGSMSQQLCEHCKCQISSKKDGSQAIHSMGLICNAGTITWFGATGGVLLELTPFIHGNFRACFKTESDNHTHIKVSQDHISISRHKNHKIRVEKARSFKLKHLLTFKKKSKELCVDSRSGEPVLLYIESVRSPGVGGVSKVIFHYDMEKLDSSLPFGSMDDCRPCTKEELLDAYCSMDFIVIGRMSEVKENQDSERTDITVEIKQVIHQMKPTFFRRIKRSHPHLTGTINVPKKCRIQKDEGEFLFAGRVRLGRLALKCAPYLHDWRRIQHEVDCTHI